MRHGKYYSKTQSTLSMAMIVIIGAIAAASASVTFSLAQNHWLTRGATDILVFLLILAFFGGFANSMKVIELAWIILPFYFILFLLATGCGFTMALIAAGGATASIIATFFVGNQLYYELVAIKRK